MMQLQDRQSLTIADAHAIIERDTEEIRFESIVESPRLSVCLITYNHRPFIQQAIDSVLEQQTDFPLEIVIGDDGSDDGTTEIVQQYQSRHPDKIRLLLSRKNLGRHTGNGRLNFIRTLRACRGEFIALLEGDDYWTAPHKLQRQVDALTAHPEWSICFHSTRYFWEDGSKEPFEFPLQFSREVSTLDDLLSGNFIQTCSAVLRNSHIGELPDWFVHCGAGDWPLFALTAQHGDIGYLREVMAAYRVHSGGYWSSKPEILGEALTMQTYLYLHRHLAVEHTDEIEQRMIDRFTEKFKHLQDHLSDRERSIDLLRHHIVKIQNQHERSLSYRLGRKLLAPLRAVQQLIRRPGQPRAEH